ncbi:ABC transporter substrate-binding protein [Actinokineospora cianjurensis]|uniref:Peptide/nickel transport system substrate-binding protein n=1 Tax=Actinokineospora cianjurensis TaxID=585224 RepID=A0A421B1D0_9PSEU|nr:ABC transporter substrate-binding protein [Actinokineospora cianjurensis]RLK58086.1 peptide/nickel transport system substrate-binding protein [Actinokineospora cianjurensis]
MNDHPRRGGVLRLYGPGSMDHVDPASSFFMLSGQIIRLFTRQLFAYPPIKGLRDWRDLNPVADVATEIPTAANGGISADRLTYTVRLRAGVRWDTTPEREVTAQDFVRGFKRMCNPVLRSGAIHYFTSTLVGMQEYCADYTAAVPDNPTAADLAEFQNAHEIAGVTALDDRTLRLRLLRPATDFIHILATAFTSPAPVEYDAFIPDSDDFRRGVRSCGPYRLTEYVHGEMLHMEPNRAWSKESDPVRCQHLDGVHVTMDRAATPADVGREIRSGRADLSWASPVTEPYDINPDDPADNLGYAVNPYLAFNMVSPNAGGAVTKLGVRRAIAYAVNKTAMIKIFDELAAGTVMWTAHTAIPPGNYGYRDYDLYPTPNDEGDPDRARALLVEAGYGDGLELTVVHRDMDANPEVAQQLQLDLARIGITLRLVGFGHAEHYPHLQNPANARAGTWDIAVAAWTPDWFGDNGRAFLQPMFQTNAVHGTGNYGCYSNPDVDRMIDHALSRTDPDEASAAWHEVDHAIMRDAAIVPVLVHAPTIPHLRGARVRDAVAMPTVDRWFDLSNLWLAEPDPPAPTVGSSAVR